jgi:hypothetical protein
MAQKSEEALIVARAETLRMAVALNLKEWGLLELWLIPAEH